ncbi:MAG TPA: hypothetical protein VMX75_03090 [Spirochaetia bacterium]|nr:hypothetical protein [Spirochaetia bacterium]
MKRFWSLYLLVLLSLILAVPSGTAQEALFTFTPPKEGESVLVTDVSRIEIDAEVKAGGSVLANLNQLQSKLERSRIRLLAVREGRIRKIQTTYEALEALNKQNEVEEGRDFPVLGKTYIVEDRGEGALSVTYSDGGAPDWKEARHW